MKFIGTNLVRLAIACALSGMTFYAHAQAKVATVIKGAGCVEAGVEAGCLVVNNAGDKKTYNLLFGSGKKPTVGMAITFQGSVHSGPTTCMQGTPVNVTKWTQTKMMCPKPSGNK
jgi:hypothetical protein